MSKVRLEWMSSGPVNDYPERTEISLAETKRLVLEWREAVKRWYAEHHEDEDSAAPVRSYPN